MQIRTSAGIAEGVVIVNAVTGQSNDAFAPTAQTVSSVTTYVAITNFTGATAGDFIRLTQVVDVVTSQPISTTWANVTKATILADAPDMANLALQSQNGLTEAELRSMPLAVSDPTTQTTLASLLTALTGDPASLTTLTEQQIALLTQLTQYNDGVEGLLTTATTNTANLETLLTQLGLNTDQVETIMAAVRDRLPATLGAKLATGSLSVVLASDHVAVPVSGPLTSAQLATAGLATDSGVAAVKTAVDAVTAKLIAAPATEATLAAVSAKLPATLGQKLAAQSMAVTLPTDQTAIPVTGPLTSEQFSAAELATDATALDAQSPMGWEEDAAGNITRVFRYSSYGLQQHTLTETDTGGGKTAYIPGPWQAAVGIPA